MNDEHSQPRTITVSSEFLRAELAGLELRLVEKLASKEAVEAVESRLGGRVETLERTALTIDGPTALKVQEHTTELATQKQTMETLERDKAGRAAVDSYKKFLLGGGVVMVLVAVLQLAITLYLLSKGAEPPPQGP